MRRRSKKAAFSGLSTTPTHTNPPPFSGGPRGWEGGRGPADRSNNNLLSPILRVLNFSNLSVIKPKLSSNPRFYANLWDLIFSSNRPLHPSFSQSFSNIFSDLSSFRFQSFLLIFKAVVRTHTPHNTSPL